MRAAVSIGITGRTDAATVRTLAALVERLGFHALWINDIPGGDSLAGLRVAAEATATLGLATGVIPLDRRPVGTLDLGGVPADRTEAQSILPWYLETSMPWMGRAWARATRGWTLVCPAC